MSAPQALTLQGRDHHRCLLGHPWVFRGELDAIGASVADGDAVQVVDGRGRSVGFGFYSHRSRIAVRLLTHGDAPITAELLQQRIAAAIALRARLTPRPARRLISSEADLLPGLIVDQYDDALVVQATTSGMDRRLGTMVELLAAACAPSLMVERDDAPVRALEGLPSRTGVLHGSGATTRWVRLGAVDVEVDLLDAHKTGAYLDQLDNHLAVARWLPQAGRIVDVFCHRGGFALHALAAGASSAQAVDTAQEPLAAARASAARMGLADRLGVHQADAFAWLRAAGVRGERADLVVVDPPSFARTRAAVEGALRGYRDLHVHALRLLAVGGRIATFTCSHHVGEDAFIATLVSAAAECRRTLRLDERLGPGRDHPELPAVPETRYLKGLVATVISA